MTKHQIARKLGVNIQRVSWGVRRLCLPGLRKPNAPPANYTPAETALIIADIMRPRKAGK